MRADELTGRDIGRTVQYVGRDSHVLGRLREISIEARAASAMPDGRVLGTSGSVELLIGGASVSLQLNDSVLVEGRDS